MYEMLIRDADVRRLGERSTESGNRVASGTWGGIKISASQLETGLHTLHGLLRRVAAVVMRCLVRLCRWRAARGIKSVDATPVLLQLQVFYLKKEIPCYYRCVCTVCIMPGSGESRHRGRQASREQGERRARIL